MGELNMSKRYDNLAPSQHMVIRSFRISKDLLEELKKFAAKNKISSNRLLNNILERYCKLLFYADYYGFIGFPKVTFKEFLSKIPEDSLVMIARDTVAVVLKDIALMRGWSTNLQSFCNVVRDYICEFYRWARYEETTDYKTSKKGILLTHEFGNKWSLFLKECLSVAYKEFVGKQPEISLSSTSVTLFFHV
jgi:predicted DNA-binding ribbon-helix-helix protein